MRITSSSGTIIEVPDELCALENIKKLDDEILIHIVHFYEIIMSDGETIDEFFSIIPDRTLKLMYNVARHINFEPLLNATISEWRTRNRGFYTIHNDKSELETLIPVAMALKMNLIANTHNYNTRLRKFYISADPQNFGHVINYLYLASNKEAYTIGRPIDKNYAPLWAMEFVKHFSVAQLKALGDLCHYLLYDEFLELICAELAIRIIGETNYSKLNEYFE